MRVVVALLVAALCVQFASGAVLIRFINTVPNTAPQVSLSGSVVYNSLAGTESQGYALRDTTVKYRTQNNRIGLNYFAPSSSGNNLNTPTTVWTELNTGRGATWADLHGVSTNPGTASTFAYQMAMPPLRNYHDHSVANLDDIAAVDRLSHYYTNMGLNNPIDGADTTQTNSNGGNFASYFDVMDSIGLKADGVGQYLTFAAGSYKMQAYGILGGANALAISTSAIKTFASSLTTMEFKDWHTYTLVATGSAGWVPAGTEGSVYLKLIEESTAPVSFGKVAVRFFHAIQPESTRALDVYSGADVSTATQIVSGLQWQTYSPYVEMKPSTAQVFPLAYGSGASVNTVASDIRVTFDLRAGSRVTIICAVTETTNNQVFCRQIPSRVVSYVRMVNDMQDINNHVQGRLGPQKFSETSLSLWASWEFPRPAVQDETNQDVSNSQMSASPLLSTGLYNVIPASTAGSVSGYGEVHVPLFIMDKAVRASVYPSGNSFNSPAAAFATGYASDTFDSHSTNVVNSRRDRAGYDYSARYKRVNLLVKTDGFATVTDRRRTVATDFTILGSAYKSTSTMDIPMEAGQYYTFFVTPANQGATATSVATLQTVETTAGIANPQNGAVVEFGLTVDRHIDDLSQGIVDGKARVRFVPFGMLNSDNHPGPNRAGNAAYNTATAYALRQWRVVTAKYDGTSKPAVNGLANSPTITLTPRASGVSATTGHIPVSNYIRLDPHVQYMRAMHPTYDNYLEVPAGDYTFSVVTNGQADKCDWAIPSVDLSVASGEYASIYVLNWYGCKSATTQDPSKLSTVIVKEFAVTTPQNTQTAAQETFFGAASSVSASISLLIAGVLAILAVLF